MAKQDFWDVITEMMLAEDDDLALRLEEQDAALREARCCDERLGAYVEEYDLEYLYSVLELGDEEFAGRIPDLRHVTREGRARLAREVREHVAVCRRCALKQGYDLEWEARIKRTCRANKQALRGLLRKDNPGHERREADAAGGDGDDAAPRARAATD